MWSRFITDEALREFRSKHLLNSELASGKWSTDRWMRAEEYMQGEIDPHMPLEVGIKTNEVLPARDKAPRPIISSGDRGQFMASLMVKAIEKSFSTHFKDANIKGRTKREAMAHVANRLNMWSRGGKTAAFHIVEGDGSAWDSCCNPEIRDQIENVLLEHVAEYFKNDPAFWQVYSEALIANAKQKNLTLKTSKMAGIVGVLSGLRFKRYAGPVRASRDVHIFNWVTNFVLWTCVLASDPWVFVGKTDGKIEYYKNFAPEGLAGPHPLVPMDAYSGLLSPGGASLQTTINGLRGAMLLRGLRALSSPDQEQLSGFWGDSECPGDASFTLVSPRPGVVKLLALSTYWHRTLVSPRMKFYL